jgi:hypothetical protein
MENNMSLFRKVDGVFVPLSADDEAIARADANNLFANDSGYEILLSADEATAIRARWAANPPAVVQQSQGNGDGQVA